MSFTVYIIFIHKNIMPLIVKKSNNMANFRLDLENLGLPKQS